MNSEPPLGNPQETIDEQRQEIAQLERKLDQLRGLAQTLVGGLVVAIALALGVAAWFAYRSLLQEQIARRAMSESDETQTELAAEIDGLQSQLQEQQTAIEQSETRVPQELESLTETLSSHQRQLELLRDRVSLLEDRAGIASEPAREPDSDETDGEDGN